MDSEYIDSLKKHEFDPVIKELWDDFRKVVREHGHGKESKEVLVKIYSFAPKG
ncbi:hypothetical protein D3C79_917620 [compost metagenome]